MPPISGNGGTLSIHGEATYDIRSWGRTRTADNQSYVSSQSGGKTYRIRGNKDMTFAISLFSPDGDLDLKAGLEEGATVEVIATTDGVKSWTGNVIIDSIEVVTNIETGENISIEIAASAVDSTSYPA